MRRIHATALALSTLLGLFVGVWAYVFPAGFYDSFPGVLGSWVSAHGPFNEHLIGDVGAMYLALSAASIGGLIWRNPLVYRVLGIAWTVFGVLHFGYHLRHLDHLAGADLVAEVTALAVSLLLGVVLLIPGRSATATTADAAADAADAVTATAAPGTATAATADPATDPAADPDPDARAQLRSGRPTRR